MVNIGNRTWLTRKEMIERGWPKVLVDKLLHSKWVDDFAIRSGSAPNSKFLIDPYKFEKYRKAVR